MGHGYGLFDVVELEVCFGGSGLVDCGPAGEGVAVVALLTLGQASGGGLLEVFQRTSRVTEVERKAELVLL
ncbi:hypothetical protein AB0454_43235 [Streptomyces sp. NPDC093509]|uniref:hypothetical protein n=1 Tax=Streptomyces sp. NPDC093509 TaxID=3154982 RepID=UPI00344F3E9B